jgi:signal transduction histidine kinase
MTGKTIAEWARPRSDGTLRAPSGVAPLAASDAVAPIFAILSHELRTPLSAVIGYAELLRDGEADALSRDERHDHVTAILDNARRLQSVIAQVLDVFRLQTGTLTLDERDWDAGELLEVAVRNVAAQAERRHVSVHANLAHGISVRGDKHRLAVAVAAILDNALAFAPEHSTVAITMVLTPLGGLTITLTDQGPGLSSADLARLSQPFTQIHEGMSRPHSGLGIGLYVARGIMDLHGGSLALTSEPGKGAQVQLSLPAARVTWRAADVAVERTTG